MTADKALLLRMTTAAPGYYTEADGGDWYIVTPDHTDRIGEDFPIRSDARRFMIWLAVPNEDMPNGWRVTSQTHLAFSLTHTTGTRATLWSRPIERLFPDKHRALCGLAALAKAGHHD